MNVEFTKHAVLTAIDDLSESVPTPTDPEHGADWWNEPFATRIKSSWKDALEDLGNRIELLREL